MTIEDITSFSDLTDEHMSFFSNMTLEDASLFDNVSSDMTIENVSNFLYLLKLFHQCLNETEIKHSSYTNNNHDPNGTWCKRTYDGYACWDETPAATTAYQLCPKYVMGYDPQRYVYKRCTDNGTWFSFVSDYKTCVDLEDLSFRNIVNNIYVCGYSVSVVTLVISIFMFIYYRALQCTRIRVHLHLFSASVINNILWIIWYKRVVNHPETVKFNQPWCQILHVVTHYFMVTCYMWMFLEALHLCIALNVVFVNDELAMRWFVTIGWGLSTIITAIYSLVRIYGSGDTERCWMDQSDSFWVIAIPVVISIFVSLILLINVVCILLTKIYPANEGISVALRKAARAALLLIPLFGLQFTLIPLRPAPDSPFEKTYQVASALLTSFQGLLVSILFCFTNHDVKTAIRNHVTRALRTNDDIMLTGLTRGESLANTRENIV